MKSFLMIAVLGFVCLQVQAQQLPQPESGSGLSSAIEGSKLAGGPVQKFSDPVQKFSSPQQKLASPVQKSAASERRPGVFGNGPVFGAGGVERRKARREARDARG